MKKNNGFTLVELLTTIAIIGILSVIVVSSVIMIGNSINEREYNSKIELLSTAAELYAQDNQDIFGVPTEDCPSLVLSEACVRVENLIQNNYAEIDIKQGDKCTDIFGCVMNPVNDSSLNKEYFLIKKIKNGIDAELSGVPSIKYTLTINPVDGEWEGEKTQSLVAGDKIPLEDAQKENCTFLEWKIEGYGTINDKKYTMGEGDTTLTAKYTCNILTIDPNGGIWSGEETQILAVGATTIIDNPRKDNCTFTKWNVNGTGTLTETTFKMGEGSTTVKAEYYCTLENIPYTGYDKLVNITKSTDYIIELWGGNGGVSGSYQYGASYTKGKIELLEGDRLYINVGGRGCNTYNDYCNACGVSGYLLAGGWNGGGYGHFGGCGLEWGGSHPGGGGATDVRIGNNTINARIMVAAGAGAAESSSINSSGGGLANYYGNATQTYGFSRGSGEPGYAGVYNCGGSCWWGAYPTSGSGGGYMGAPRSGHGGTSYISGHTGSIAVDESGNAICTDTKTAATSYVGTTNAACSVHYSNKKFTETVMIDGAGYSWSNRINGLVQMPNPNGGVYASGYGHRDNGYARISYIDK